MLTGKNKVSLQLSSKELHSRDVASCVVNVCALKVTVKSQSETTRRRPSKNQFCTELHQKNNYTHNLTNTFVEWMVLIILNYIGLVLLRYDQFDLMAFDDLANQLSPQSRPTRGLCQDLSTRCYD